MKHKLMTVTILIMAVFAVPVRPAVASTWYVNGVSGSDSHDCKSRTTECKTAGHAISLASSGDSIVVAPATYFENLTISKSLNVTGSGASTTYIDGGGAGTVVTISHTALVTLERLTITNGSVGSATLLGGGGGGINNSGALTLTNSTVTENSAFGPYICPGSRCIVRGTAFGGGIYNSGALIISNSVISGNHASSGCTFGPCEAFGGGIYNVGTLMMINNSTLTGNIARIGCSAGPCGVGEGGAFYSAGISGATVTLNNSTVEGNSANQGGGIVNSSNLAMNNGTVSGNSPGGISKAAQRRCRTALSRTILAQIVVARSRRMGTT